MPALWGAVIAGGASLLGGAMQADAAGSASDAQLGATREGVAEQRRQFDLIRNDSTPWRTTGSGAVYRLADLLGIAGNPANQGFYRLPQPTREQFTSTVTAPPAMRGLGQIIDWNGGPVYGNAAPTTTQQFDKAGYDRALAAYNESFVPSSTPAEFGSLLKPFTGADVANEPGYQFGLNQGNEALRGAAAAKGMRLSPATVKALERFNQDYAGTKFGEAFNRDQVQKNQVFNMLSGVAGTGQTATAQTASAGMNMANNVSDLITQGGNARAAGIMGRANAFSGGIQNAANTYFGHQTLNNFMKNGFGGSNMNNSPYIP